MPDDRVAQVLSLHRISPRCYDLSSVRTGSVKDQLVRSTLLADALVASGLIVVMPDSLDDPDEAAQKKRLLVFGAGVSGIALALTAAELGAEVTVIEMNDYPFGSWGTCHWRTVDPTEYDWPHPHWTQSRLPAQLPGRPPPPTRSLALPPSRTSGTGLVTVWWGTHSAILFPGGSPVPYGSNQGSVCILYNHDANLLSIDDSAAAIELARRTPGDLMLSVSKAMKTPLVRVETHWAQSPTWVGEPFAAVVSCIGFGTEKTYEWPRPAQGHAPAWSGFKGHGFWQDDDGMRIAGFKPGPHRAIPTAILISGSGDGAMQDFQRATTRLFGLDLYDEIVRTVGPGRFRPENAMLDASLAEDYARRAHGWKPAGSSLGESFAYWDDQFALAVHEVWTRWSRYEQSTVANHVLRPEVLNGLLGHTSSGTRVRWVIREAAPTYSYGLNRFLSMLVLRLMEHVLQPPIAPILRLRHQISSITPVAPHTCNGDPQLCYGEQHEVVLSDLETNKALPSEHYDFILIRHGQEPAPLLGGASVPEQQVPFDLPR